MNGSYRSYRPATISGSVRGQRVAEVGRNPFRRGANGAGQFVTHRAGSSPRRTSLLRSDLRTGGVTGIGTREPLRAGRSVLDLPGLSQRIHRFVDAQEDRRFE